MHDNRILQRPQLVKSYLSLWDASKVPGHQLFCGSVHRRSYSLMSGNLLLSYRSRPIYHHSAWHMYLELHGQQILFQKSPGPLPSLTTAIQGWSSGQSLTQILIMACSCIWLIYSHVCPWHCNCWSCKWRWIQDLKSPCWNSYCEQIDSDIVTYVLQGQIVCLQEADHTARV